ncbi:DUF3467 domain-containing protein [Rubricoccus marinus]|uniref:Transcriptional accessory protein n=1 Tax=Rubricoccus marinus TaxID=716817 RepID=A0A259TZP2_9BACT|nr:DUF3467 domain-containing protein [Rubricoccus marinus]OZC03067.1 hypothetical protein BSZ36_08845 [Rubricoccus marinus]
MEPDPNAPQQQLQIELTPDVAEGEYSNLVMIAHSPEEFILDFIRVMPGVPKARVKSRVVVTPSHAKRLLAALADNIQRFEAQYGEIAQSQQNNFPGVAFSGPGGEA